MKNFFGSLFIVSFAFTIQLRAEDYVAKEYDGQHEHVFWIQYSDGTEEINPKELGVQYMDFNGKPGIVITRHGLPIYPVKLDYKKESDVRESLHRV